MEEWLILNIRELKGGQLLKYRVSPKYKLLSVFFGLWTKQYSCFPKPKLRLLNFSTNEDKWLWMSATLENNSVERASIIIQ